MQIAIKYKKNITFGFYLFYLFTVGLGLFSIYQIINKISIAAIYDLGKTAGELALGFFCLTLIPGIFRRFKWRSAFVQILMLFRRQLGISTFLLGFLHYGALRLFPILFAGVPLNTNPPVFEIFGMLTLYPMTLLFLTSNDLSVRRLGQWWKVLHSLSYILVWTLFFHTALQSKMTWMSIIGIVALLELASLIYSKFSIRNTLEVD